MKSDELPFTGWECPRCSYFARDEEAVEAHVCFTTENIHTIKQRARQFVNRFALQWNRDQMARELDELITIAKEVGNGRGR